MSKYKPHESQINELSGGYSCSWCGADLTDNIYTGSLDSDGNPKYVSKQGETFCCKSHMRASARALNLFLKRSALNEFGFLE